MKRPITLLVAALILLSGCISQEEPPETTVPTTLEPTTLETTVPRPTTTMVSTTPVIVSENLKPGETASISNLEVEVESFEKMDSMLYYDIANNQPYRLKAPSGKTFLVVNAMIRNREKTGKFSPTLNISRFSVTDADGNSYSPEKFEGADLIPLSKTLNSGNEMEGRVVFKVPKDAEGLILSYDFTGLEAGAGEEKWDIE